MRQTNQIMCLAAIFVLLNLYANASEPNNLKIIHLRCEYHINPIGIDELTPRLSWKLQSKERGHNQSAYRILVASNRELLAQNNGDFWDSGKIISNQSIHIVYQGKKLASHMQCFWKVKVWDNKGSKPFVSKIAHWRMGLLKQKDWKAKWIGYDAKTQKPSNKSGKTYLPSPYLRKKFTISKPIVRAYLYVTAQGFAEMHLNGKRVSNEYFTPGWSDYQKRIYYRTYNVTSMLKQGTNAIGCILGDGWFRGNIGNIGQNKYGDKIRLLAQLHIDYVDGNQLIISDASWKASFGPILESDMQAGETYDARREISGWNMPDFNGKNWKAVNIGTKIKPLIQAYPGVPVRKTQELKTIKITQPKSGIYVFDLGQNFSGWIKLKVKGKAGNKVVMRFAEMLNANGTAYTKNLRSARATDTYILKGKGEEIWEPHFTFHGFRYVQIIGLPSRPTPETVTGMVVHSDAPMTSSFACSNPLLNKLHNNIVWGQRSNYLEVPMDCPQRDERLGWTGDTQVFIRTGTFNQDVATFFTKWIVDLMDTQKNGKFGNQAPTFEKGGSPGWADAGIICPWTIFEVYGDTRLIKKNYRAMARFIDYCLKSGLSGPGGGFGDWLSIGSKTPKKLISAAYLGYSTSLMVKMAKTLGKKDDVVKYKKLFKSICSHFQNNFVLSSGKIKGHTQTAYCLALHFNLLTNAQYKQATQHLIERIKAKNYHLSVGFIGVPILLPTLTEIGRSDLAYRLIQNATYPSWGYSIKQGATTIWEHWNSYTKKDGFAHPAMNSFNHYAYGACGEWMFRSILGIDTDGPGFKKITMKPELGKGVSWAKGHYNSIYGRISSDWKWNKETFHWKIVIPSNTSATVHIPAIAIANIVESNQIIKNAKNITFLRMENHKAIFRIASGTYHFVSKLQ